MSNVFDQLCLCQVSNLERGENDDSISDLGGSDEADHIEGHSEMENEAFRGHVLLIQRVRYPVDRKTWLEF